MRQLTILMAVLGLLGLAATMAVTGVPTSAAPETRSNNAVKIRIEEKNPFTHLQVNDRPNSFQFAIVSDRTGGRRPGVFSKAVEKINLLQPEFVLSVGDLIEGYSEDPGAWALEWSEFETKLTRLQMPFFFCPGNHDIANLPMSKEWYRKFGRTYYEFRYQDCLFVVLNTEDEPKKDREYFFKPEQRAWLSRRSKTTKTSVGPSCSCTSRFGRSQSTKTRPTLPPRWDGTKSKPRFKAASTRSSPATITSMRRASAMAWTTTSSPRPAELQRSPA